jgi:hypothetical protein
LVVGQGSRRQIGSARLRGGAALSYYLRRLELRVSGRPDALSVSLENDPASGEALYGPAGP